MHNRYDKNGPELLIIDDSMLQGLSNLANIFKQQHDEHTYEFLTNVKTALTKYKIIANHINEIAKMNRTIAKALLESADYSEQLFPLLQEKK